MNDKIKNFWINKLKKIITDWKPSESSYYYREIKDTWENDLKGKKTLPEIAEKVLDTYKIIHDASSWFGSRPLNYFQLLDKSDSKEEYFWLVHEVITDYEKDLTNLETELNNYKNTWDGHTCSSTSCPHTDYDTIKSQRDSLQIQNTNLIQEKNTLSQEKNNLQTERDRLKEQLDGKSDFDKIKGDITKQIINDSGLDIDKESNLEQLISKIKELIKNPDDTRERERAISDLRQEKEKLQTQITEKDQVIADLQKPKAEVLDELKQKIRENWKKIGIDNQVSEKSLSEVQTYQQLVDLEQQKNKDFFDKLNKSKSRWKASLITSLIIFIPILGGLGYLLLKKKKPNISYKNESGFKE